MRHAAMLTSLEMLGSVSPRASLWLIKLAGDRDVTLVHSVLAGAEGQHRGRGEADNQRDEEGDEAAAGAPSGGEHGRWPGGNRVRSG